MKQLYRGICLAVLSVTMALWIQSQTLPASFPATGSPVMTVLSVADFTGQACSTYNVQYYNPLTNQHWACSNANPSQNAMGTWVLVNGAPAGSITGNSNQVSGGVNATAYNWNAQTPGGTLTAGTQATVTLTPCPAGISGSDTNLWVYLSGGTGTAEAVNVTGGTCSSGASGGTLVFTPANSHSGAWQLSSAFAGVYEAIRANLGRAIYVPAGDYLMRACMVLDGGGTNGFSLYGDLPSTSVLDFSGISTGCDGLTIRHTEFLPVSMRDLQLVGGNSMNGTGNGLVLDDSDENDLCQVGLHHVTIQKFSKSGVYVNQSYELVIDDHSLIGWNGFWGLDQEGQVNLTVIRDSFLGNNSAAGNYGGMIVNGSSASTTNSNLLIENTDFGEEGTTPFSGANPTDAVGLSINHIANVSLFHNWFENEAGYLNAITYGSGVESITEIGNYIVDGAITYNANTQNVDSHQNTFDRWHTPGTRSLPSGTDMIAGWRLGPDNNLGAGNIANSVSVTGVPAQQFQYYDYNKTANIGPITMACYNGAVVCPEGLYRLSVYMWTQNTASAGNASFALSYNDMMAVKTVSNGALGTPANLDLTKAGAAVSGESVFAIKPGGANPSYTITLNGVSGSPKFGYILSLEKLQ